MIPESETQTEIQYLAHAINRLAYVLEQLLEIAESELDGGEHDSAAQAEEV